MEENRFLRCVAEERGVDRFRRLVAEERGYRALSPPTSPAPTLLTPTSPTNNPTIIYYSPKSDTTPPQTKEVKESFEERYRRTLRQQKGLPPATQATPKTPTTPTTPTVTNTSSFWDVRASPIGPTRQRQGSQLSVASEESFPSLPSAKSTPASPTVRTLGWSDVAKKPAEMETGSLGASAVLGAHKAAMATATRSSLLRVVATGTATATATAARPKHAEEDDIVYDEDGFPFLRSYD